MAGCSLSAILSAASTLRGTSLSRGRPGANLTRLDADHLTILRHAGAKVSLREARLRAGGRKAGLRLRHVGARHLAHIEAVVGLAQLLVDHFHVVALEIENGRVAQDVHVGGSGIEQRVLFAVRERLSGAQNRTFGLLDRILGAKPVEQILVDLQTDAAGIQPFDVVGPACRDG